MIQVWLIDENGFYINESKFVEELEEGMTDIPLLVGYVKPKFVNGEWQEGATEEEIQSWKDGQQIDICLEPTELQVLQEQVTKLIINQL